MFLLRVFFKPNAVLLFSVALVRDFRVFHGFCCFLLLLCVIFLFFMDFLPPSCDTRDLQRGSFAYGVMFWISTVFFLCGVCVLFTGFPSPVA